MQYEYNLPYDNFSIIENELIGSPAFLGLTGTAIKIYLLLRSRAMIEKPKSNHRGRGSRAYIKNNGYLTLTYKEIKEILDISSSTISSAFKELQKLGLIDIAKAGQGRVRIKSRYAISQRWRQYGKPGFQDIEVHRHVCIKGARALKETSKTNIKDETLPPPGHSTLE